MAQGVVKCELCVNDEDGTWFCKNCHQSLCETCQASHLRANISKHHEIISRMDMSHTQGETARQVDEYCATHTKEFYILYCTTCLCLICRMCLTEKHAQHDVIAIEQIFQEQRQKAEKYVRILSQREVSLTTAVYEALAKEIKDEARKVRVELDAATSDMLKQAKGHCQQIDEVAMQSKEKTEVGLRKLNRSLQGNKVSEIIEAVQYFDLMETDLETKSILKEKWTFVPGKHNVKETGKLLGHLKPPVRSKEKPSGFTVTYAHFDVKSMCLRYNFPDDMREQYIYPFAQLTGSRPFSETLKEFSIKIKRGQRSRAICIGMVPKGYKVCYAPGWGSRSYGYHADDGCIFSGSGILHRKGEKCYDGDVMKCSFDVDTRTLTFLKNGVKVSSKEVSTKYQYYPMVALKSQGQEVLLLEKDPWLL